jgi:hypothetical protein
LEVSSDCSHGLRSGAKENNKRHSDQTADQGPPKRICEEKETGLDQKFSNCQAGIIPQSIWGAFKSTELFTLLEELAASGVHYGASPVLDAEGFVLNGQIIFRVDELFKYAAQPGVEIPVMRKFLRLVDLECGVEGCMPKFFRSLIRIYVGNSGKGLKHHDQGV